MNDSKRRHTSLHARWERGARRGLGRVVTSRTLPTLVAVAALAGCGSSASSGTEGAGSGAHAARPSEVELARDALKAAAKGQPEIVQPPSHDETYAPAAPPVFVCQRDPVAFDLSRLLPTASTPAAFWWAWVYAQEHSDVPGFVVTYFGTAGGPTVHARVGAVHPVAGGIYSFMRVLGATEPVLATIDAADPFHVTSYHDSHEFVTAFGTVYHRQGFSVSMISVDGRLDQKCQALHDVYVTMTLPRSNVGQRFGNMTIDEELGPMNHSDGPNGEPDGWNVTMAAPSLEAIRFRP